VSVLSGCAGKPVTVGGVPSLLGYGDPYAPLTPGMRVPTGVRHHRCRYRCGGNKKSSRIVETERCFRAVTDASHFRYPLVYGRISSCRESGWWHGGSETAART
jgi:hypothetical protein